MPFRLGKRRGGERMVGDAGRNLGSVSKSKGVFQRPRTLPSDAEHPEGPLGGRWGPLGRRSGVDPLAWVGAQNGASWGRGHVRETSGVSGSKNG